MPKWEKDNIRGKEIYRNKPVKPEYCLVYLLLVISLIFIPFMIVATYEHYFSLELFTILVIISIILLLFIIRMFFSYITFYDKGVLLRSRIPILNFFPKFYPWEEIVGCKIINFIVKGGMGAGKHKMLTIYFSNQHTYEMDVTQCPDFEKIYELIQNYKKGKGEIPQEIIFCPRCGAGNYYFKDNICIMCGTKVLDS